MFNPYLSCQADVGILALKAHLVIRMVQLKIGEDLLIQVRCRACDVTDARV